MTLDIAKPDNSAEAKILPQMYEYNGYKVIVRNMTPPVSVFDPRDKRSALYRTTSLDLAAKWIDAYRAAEAWAIAARL
jgi:hypothetical protein